jgi:hypothetical protein
MTAGRTTLVIIGAIVGLVGAMVLVAGGALLWAQGTQRDADGYLTTPALELATDGYAITAEGIDLAVGARPGDWIPQPGDVAARISVTSELPVFIGIAAESDVDDYLAGVAHAEIATVDRRAVTYRSAAGTAPQAPPGEQGIWVASTQGEGRQTVEWDVQQGQWAVVVMNADASAGVATTATGGAWAAFVTPLGIGLVLGGVVLGAIAAAMVVAALGGTAQQRVPATAQAGPYPVTLEGRLDPDLSRWQWLVKWFLAIPHYVVLALLWIAFMGLTVVAGFAILFTGRYPRSIFDVNVGVLRWTWRVAYYSYSALSTDQYPPFTLAATDYPATLDIAYPESLSRGLVLVKWWLLAIPHYVVVALFTGSVLTWTVDAAAEGRGDLVLGGGLIGILVLIAGAALAITGRYPRGLFDLIMGLNRWVYRVVAYAALMTDEYPPFRLDIGGGEPVPPSTGPPPDHAPAAVAAPVGDRTAT